MYGIFHDPGVAPGASPTHGLVTGATGLPSASALPSAGPQPTATAAPASCGSATVTVNSATSLQAALSAAKPGDVIAMANGTYVGQFVATASGTADAPITLCGGAGSVIDGDGIDEGYGFHLDGAKYWVLTGFTVTNAQKGVMADGTVGSVIEGLTVHGIGDEGIHLRNFSTDNVVRGNTVYDTGNRRDKFGEGIYVGTAHSNWCTVSQCNEDHSDRNVVVGNTIYDTTAESVDIKEGTSDGVVKGNSFSGAAMTKKGGDSWVDVKGNDWVIEGNEGIDSPNDGFQVHEEWDGWGKGNVFRDNTATVNGPGFGFSLTPEADNVVKCDNTVSDAKEGFANVPCR
jgi:parallel beta-helix repeat protein